MFFSNICPRQAQLVLPRQLTVDGFRVAARAYVWLRCIGGRGSLLVDTNAPAYYSRSGDVDDVIASGYFSESAAEHAKPVWESRTLQNDRTTRIGAFKITNCCCDFVVSAYLCAFWSGVGGPWT